MKKQSQLNSPCVIFALSMCMMMLNIDVVRGEGLKDQLPQFFQNWSRLPRRRSEKNVLKKLEKPKNLITRIQDSQSESPKSQETPPWYHRRDTDNPPSVPTDAAVRVAVDSVAARAQAALGLSTSPRRVHISDIPTRKLPPSTLESRAPEDFLPKNWLSGKAPASAGSEIPSISNSRLVDRVPSTTTYDTMTSLESANVDVHAPDVTRLPAGAKILSMTDRVVSRSSVGVLEKPSETFTYLPKSRAPSIPSSSTDELAARHLQTGYDLIVESPERAANEFLRAVAVVAESRDVAESTTVHTDSLRNAIGAMIESELLADAMIDGELVVQSVIQEFRTPVGEALRNGTITSSQSVEAYPDFIQKSFEVATGKSALASKAFYGLARVHLSRWQQDETRASDRKRLESLLTTAIAVDDTNWRANNELGILFAQDRQLDKAAEAFRKSIRQRPTAQNWNNLAKIFQEQGKHQLAVNALNESVALRGGPKQPIVSKAEDSLKPKQLAQSRRAPIHEGQGTTEMAPEMAPEESVAPMASFLRRIFRPGDSENLSTSKPRLAAQVDGSITR